MKELDKYILLAGTNIVITGVGQKIRLAVAKLLVKYGGKMAMTDHNGHSFIQAEKTEGNAIAFKCNVADEAQVKKTVDNILIKYIMDMRQEAV